MGKKLSFYLIFSFFRVPFKVFGKNVDRWTRAFFYSFLCFLSSMYPLIVWQKVWTGGQALNILKKKSTPFMFYSKVWTCRQEAVFQFFVSFLPYTLQNHVKKYEHK